MPIDKEALNGFINSIQMRLINLSKGSINDEYILRKLFGHFDVQRTGLMTLDELYGILDKLEMFPDPQYAEILFKLMDKGNKGVIHFDYFVNLVLDDQFHKL